MLSIPPLAVLSIVPTPKSLEGVSQQVGNQLELGQMLKATVLEAIPDNRFLLEAGGNRVLIQSQTQLSVGQMLDVEVAGTPSKLEFNLLPSSVHQLFGQALSTTAKTQDLTSIFSLLQQISPSQLQKLNNSSSQTLESFSRLLMAILPQQTSNPQVSSQQVLAQYIDLATTQLNSLVAGGNQSSAVNGIKSIVQDISQFFITKGEVQSLPSAKLLDNLSTNGKNILESIYSLQGKNQQAGTSRSADQAPSSILSEVATNKILQSVGLNPQNPFVQGKADAPITLLNKGFGELFFLLKSPESINLLLTSSSLRSGFLSSTQQQSITLMQSPQQLGNEKSGAVFKDLVNKLGLNLENNLASGNKEAATQTVKLALLDMLQNDQISKSVQESGQQALKTIEFYQLAQLQLNRDNSQIFPLPFDFLQKGYLLVEDYDKGKNSDDNNSAYARFTLFLTLRQLGNLKIEFHNDGSGLSIKFMSESKETSEFIAGYRDELKDSITNVSVKNISFIEGTEDPLTELVQKNVPRGKTFFNVKA